MRSKSEKRGAELKVLPNPDKGSCRSDTMEIENSNKNNKHENSNRTKTMLLPIDAQCAHPKLHRSGFHFISFFKKILMFAFKDVREEKMDK